MVHRFFLFIFLFLFHGIGYADEAFFNTSDKQGYHYWKDFVNMLVTLLLVLSLIFVSIWFLKRVMRSRIRSMNRNTAIKILERRPLTQKTSLYLVSILGKGVVISESPAGIHVVTELSNDTDIEILLAEKEEEKPASPPFAQILQKKMREMMKR